MSLINLQSSNRAPPKIEQFCSGGIGSVIVNAETNIPTPYIVGSRDEYRMFKVAASVRRGSGGNNNILFYDSPNQYVKHRFRPKSYRQKRNDDNSWMTEPNELVHWRVETRDTKAGSRTFVVPFANPDMVRRWEVKRAEKIHGGLLEETEE